MLMFNVNEFIMFTISFSLHKKCPYSEFFWSIFSHLRIEYGEIRSIAPYLVRMRENTDQKNSECGHFSRSVCYFSMFNRCSNLSIVDICDGRGYETVHYKQICSRKQANKCKSSVSLI